MATTTTKLALTKPDGTDLVDIAVLNTNADKIDAASGATICTSTTRPASPWNGQIIFETDTLGGYVWRSSTSSWTSLGGSTVSSDPPATAANGDLWWDSDNGKLYIYYVDANSSQWVSVMPATTQVEVAQNYIINGDFGVNQRGLTSTTNTGYGFDRWATYNSGGTTYSSQTFTPGAAPVAGYEGTNYARLVTSGQSGASVYTQLVQKIENARTLAGQTATISFWAKAASGTPKVAVEIAQNFGTGGSTGTNVYGGQVTLSTSWARYSITVDVPSISGKTISNVDSFLALSLWVSSGSDFNARTGSLGIQSNTFDFWGVQVEKGSVPTSFRLAGGGTKQAELAACQRYYWRYKAESTFTYYGVGIAYNTTLMVAEIQPPVTMRGTMVLAVSAASDFRVVDGVGSITPTSIAIYSGNSGTRIPVGFTVASGYTAQRSYHAQSQNTNAWLELSSEL